MSARRAIAAGGFVFGLGLAGWGLWALVFGGAEVGPGSTAARVPDEGLMVLFGAGLMGLGALRLRKGSGDE